MHVVRMLVCTLMVVAATAIPRTNADIFEAAEGGVLADVKALVDQGVDVNCRDNWGTTPLMRAALNGNLEVCTFLLSNGGRVDIKDQKGFTVLDYLRNRITDPTRMSKDDVEKALGIKLQAGQYTPPAAPEEQLVLQRILRLLEGQTHAELGRAAADPNAKAALFAAVEAGNLSQVTAVIRGGVSVDSVNEKGMTPLMVAASIGNIGACELLLDHHPELATVSKEGLGVVQYAKGVPEILWLVQTAMEDRDLADIKLLVGSGLDINRPNPRRGGRTMLMQAAADGKSRLCEFLVDHGADANAKDSSGMDAAGYARRSGLPEEEKLRLVQLLLTGKNKQRLQ